MTKVKTINMPDDWREADPLTESDAKSIAQTFHNSFATDFERVCAAYVKPERRWAVKIERSTTNGIHVEMLWTRRAAVARMAKSTGLGREWQAEAPVEMIE